MLPPSFSIVRVFAIDRSTLVVPKAYSLNIVVRPRCFVGWTTRAQEKGFSVHAKILNFLVLTPLDRHLQTRMSAVNICIPEIRFAST